jgi:hypothetical protein
MFCVTCNWINLQSSLQIRIHCKIEMTWNLLGKNMINMITIIKQQDILSLVSQVKCLLFNSCYIHCLPQQ